MVVPRLSAVLLQKTKDVALRRKKHLLTLIRNCIILLLYYFWAALRLGFMNQNGAVDGATPNQEDDTWQWI